jgi:hypothetical protein
MKQQRDKETGEPKSANPGKSLYQRYHELLHLREEVKEAEQRAAEQVRKPSKADR